MTLKRAAILVEAGKAKGCDEISGPAVDARRMEEWLTSDVGGAWEPREVVRLSNPDPSKIEAALERAAGVDYAFVAFSGHGWIAQSTTGASSQKVVLGDGTSIDFDSLRPPVKKCLMVCDACREVVTFGPLTESRKLAVAAFSERKYAREHYRQWFDSAIERAADGRFVMYGCSRGQYSYESPLNGGYFTSALIECAGEWASAPPANGCLLTPEAFKRAKEVVEWSALGRLQVQTPDGGPESRSGNNFPFAVAFK